MPRGGPRDREQQRRVPGVAHARVRPMCDEAVARADRELEREARAERAVARRAHEPARRGEQRTREDRGRGRLHHLRDAVRVGGRP